MLLRFLPPQHGSFGRIEIKQGERGYLTYLTEFLKLYVASSQPLTEIRTSHRGKAQSRKKRWIPPTEGEFKTNFDGAMFEENNNAGIGIIVRNSRGEVMAALSEKIPRPPSAEILEMLAARRAVKFV